MEQLDFQYIKTYSGFRGELFTKQVNDTKSKITELEQHLITDVDSQKRYSIKCKIKRLKSDLKKFDVYNNRLIDINNNLHKLAEEVAIIQKDSKTADNIMSILTKSRVEESIVISACPPIYRDVIVFFNKSQIIKIIHCCFECIRFLDESTNEIHLNIKGIEELQTLLISIGHKMN